MLRFLLLAAALVAATLGPRAAHAQGVSAEVRARFERAGTLLERARRVRGSARRRLLEQAYEDYVGVLDSVRSRNALYNAAVVAQLLDRDREAFGYLQEYMAVEGLSDAERDEGQALLDSLGSEVAVIEVISSPAGASVYVDRLDLSPAGTTPLRVAVTPGAHTVHVRLVNHEERAERVEAALGETRTLQMTLEAEPVSVTLEVAGPADTRVLVDGEEVDALSLRLAPGPHTASVRAPGRQPVERRFVVVPGVPMSVQLNANTANELPATLAVESSARATFFLDGVRIGEGTTLEQSASPGVHELRVEAEGFASVERNVALRGDHTTRVRAELRASRTRRYGPWPHILAATTGASAVAFGALAIVAANRFDDGDARCAAGSSDPVCRSLESDLDAANRRADILLGVTGALAVTTLVLYLTRNREGHSDLRIGPFADRQSLGLSIGGRL